MGVRLLHRTTRRLSLTPAGSETLPRCRRMLEMVGDMREAVAAPDAEPRGLLRVTAAMSFGGAQLAEAVAEFVRRHPAASIDLLLVDRAVNLVEERVDLAVRITNDLDPNLIGRRLADCRSVVCVAPQYLQQHGAPARAEDLSLHNRCWEYMGSTCRASRCR
ncbi:LysR family transcriptional regulator [Bordetella pertussis]|nr:LysR family transcriptional regulator [Bordetella pertussis]